MDVVNNETWFVEIQTPWKPYLKLGLVTNMTSYGV
jgi:hypothetical protein